jgi:hypothetical protein
MAVVDQKDRYRRQAALCYDIAAKMTPAKAAAMVHLGDTYAALAIDPDRTPANIFVPTKRFEQPHCKACGGKMRLSYSLPRTRTLPSMQAFHCDRCGETLIWKRASPSNRSANEAPARVPPRESTRWGTRFVAISFRRVGQGFSPGEAIECPDARLAVRRAQLMMRDREIVGAAAFSRRADTASGEVESAVILSKLGTIPEGFDIA